MHGLRHIHIQSYRNGYVIKTAAMKTVTVYFAMSHMPSSDMEGRF